MAKQQKLRFKRLKIQSFTIIDELKKEIGRIRVEPDSVSWRPAGETHWYRLTLKDFGNLAIQNGTKGTEAS
jgi:hypothetical protein